MNRYRPYSSQKRRAIGNERAADNQTDSTTVTINSSIQVSCGQHGEWVEKFEKVGDAEMELSYSYDTGCAAINVYDVITKSLYFNNLAGLYDQVKIDNIKVDINAVNWPTNSSNEDSNDDTYVFPKNLSVVTAWDRSGLDDNQFFTLHKGDAPLPKDNYGYCIIGRNIESYSSSQTRHLGSGSAYRITRYLYPKTLEEKSQYVATTLLRKQYRRENNEGYKYYFYDIERTNVNIANATRFRFKYNVYDYDRDLPTNIQSSPAFRFKPTFLINVIAGDGVEFDKEDGTSSNNLKSCTFNLDFEVTLTFRGLRYSKII